MKSDIENGYIIIPAYQAEETLSELLERIQRCCPLKIVVVDDGSEDHTADIARKTGVHVIQHPENRGKGEALRTGFQFVTDSKGKFAITLDADLQHPPEAIPGLLVRHAEYPEACIIGERQRDKHMPVHRRWSNQITSFLVSYRIHRKIPDVQCGFRLIPGKYLPALLTGHQGFVFEAEMIIRLADRKAPFLFYPIPTIYMKEGHSSIAHVRDTLHFIKMYITSFFGRNHNVE